jgi:hypothetical protein
VRPPESTPTKAAVAALIALAIGLAGCGEEKRDRAALLSAATAGELRSELNDIEQMADEGKCEEAKANALAFEQRVDALPGKLDPELRDALSAGAGRLQRLLNRQCEPETATTAPAAPQQQPEQTEEDKGKKEKKPKEKAKGQDEQGEEEILVPEEGTTGPTLPDSGGATTP